MSRIVISLLGVVALAAAGCNQSDDSWGDVRDLACTRVHQDANSERWICRVEGRIYRCTSPTVGSLDFSLDCDDVTERLRDEN